MSEREERRFVEIPRESVRLMAESTGLELSDEVAALLAEDVCYRLREATQVRTPLATPSSPSYPLFPHPTHRGLLTKHIGRLPCAWRESCPSQGSPSNHLGFRQTEQVLGIFCAPRSSPAGQPGRFLFTCCDVGCCLSKSRAGVQAF